MALRTQGNKKIPGLLIRILSGSEGPGSSSFEELSGPDRKKLIGMAVMHGLGPLLYRWIKKSDLLHLLPPELISTLRSSYLQTLAVNTRMLLELGKISNLAKESGIQMMILKGAALLPMVYDDPGLRPMDDIDILVDEDKFGVFSELLKSIGFAEHARFESKTSEALSKGTDRYWITLIKGTIMVDLHCKIGTGEGASPVIASQFLDHTNTISFQQQNLRCPAPEAMLIHLLMHIDKHFGKGVTRYSNMVDILLMINPVSEIINWQRFEEVSKDLDKGNICGKWIGLINEEFHLSIPVYPKEDPGFAVLKKKYRQWMKRGNRQIRPVIPPWQRESYKISDRPSQKFRYFWSVLFPGFDYMQAAYGIRYRFIVPIFYPYRLITHTLRYFMMKLRRE